MSDIAELGLYIDSSGVVKATKELKKLHGQSGKNEKSTKSLSSSFSVLGAAVTALASSMVISKFIETAGAFESMQKSLETVTGSAEKASLAMAGIRDFAKETPFQVKELTDAFIKLKALGIAPTEEKLMSFGNTSSAMGKSLNQMIEAVADASTGEFERLKEFGIKARSEGENVTFTFQNVATTVGKNSKEITGYLEDIGKTQFAGAMAGQMDTINGKISNLGDSVDDLFVTFSDAGGGGTTKGALDTIIQGVNALTDGVELLPSLFVATYGEFDKFASRVGAAASHLNVTIQSLFLSDEQTMNMRIAINEQLIKEIALVDKSAAAYIAAEHAKIEAITAAGAIDVAGADPAAAEAAATAAAEKVALIAAYEMEAQLLANAIKLQILHELVDEELRIAEEGYELRIQGEQDMADQVGAIQETAYNQGVALLNKFAGENKAVAAVLTAIQTAKAVKDINIQAAAASSQVFAYGQIEAAAHRALFDEAGAQAALLRASATVAAIESTAAIATGLAIASGVAEIAGVGDTSSTTVSETAGVAPAVPAVDTSIPESVPVRHELIVDVQGEGANTDTMRQFINDFEDTLVDMGSDTRLVLS